MAGIVGMVVLQYEGHSYRDVRLYTSVSDQRKAVVESE